MQHPGLPCPTAPPPGVHALTSWCSPCLRTLLPQTVNGWLCTRVLTYQFMSPELCLHTAMECDMLRGRGGHATTRLCLGASIPLRHCPHRSFILTLF